MSLVLLLLNVNFYWTGLSSMSLTTNNSYFLAAGWYHCLASTIEYLNHIYQKKLEKC